jgi:hypothetical protein
MSGAITPLPNTPSWCGAHLKHRDNLTFNLRKAVQEAEEKYIIQRFKIYILNN